jgi:hypothetical protein
MSEDIMLSATRILKNLHSEGSRTSVLAALGVIVALAAPLASADATKHTAVKPNAAPAAAPYEPGLQPKAIELLKAACARLAGASAMTFTAVVSEEGPSLLGPPLIYTTKSEIAMRRPDRLRVITLGDGPRSEFYYDGKAMMAYAPAENLLAVAEAPPTIDQTLAVAYDSAQVYFPFTDLLVSDPYKDIADGLTTAFYIGQSHVVGGTTTDMVAIASKDVFAQIWIGAEDKLPRRMYAVYFNDRARLRHVVEFSNWELGKAVEEKGFHPTNADKAVRIAFKRPDSPVPAGKPAAAPAPKP